LNRLFVQVIRLRVDYDYLVSPFKQASRDVAQAEMTDPFAVALQAAFEGRVH
jgi:hypothetical protein